MCLYSSNVLNGSSFAHKMKTVLPELAGLYCLNSSHYFSKFCSSYRISFIFQSHDPTDSLVALHILFSMLP